MLILALKLILAHLIGDFLIQPDKWIKNKEEKTFKSPFLYWHIATHAILLFVTLQFNFNYWLGILIILTTHYIIDLAKLILHKKFNPRTLFVLDQVLHLLVIASVVYYYHPFDLPFKALYSEKSLLMITGILTVTYVTSIVIKVLLTKWKMEDTSPNQAGKYIGMLERLFVFFFVVLHFWEGVGFLLAAKSIFRFGDLSNAKDRGLTEYVLIGTLLSFGIAMLTGGACHYILQYFIK